MKAGWEIKRLGEVVEAVITGPFGSILHKSDYADEGVPLVNPANIIDEKISLEGIKLVGLQKASNLRSYELHAGDIVIGRRGEIGRCAVVTEEQAGWLCGTGSFIVRPGQKLEPRFLAAMLRSPVCLADLVEAAAGATMPNLSNGSLSNLQICYPPIDEQRRIVAVLDKAFANIANANANAQKNFTNSRALFESYLEAKLKCIVAPTKKLGAICERVTVGHVGTTSPFYREVGIPFLRTQNLTRVGINLDKLVYITDDFHRALKKSALLPGDVLISRVVTDRMNVGVVPYGIGQANCANVIAVRPGPNVDPLYLKFLIQSNSSQIELLGSKAGSAQQVVNTKVLKEWFVGIPSLERQRSAIDEMSFFEQKTDALQKHYEQTVIALTELKQSLLQKAFAGELT